MHTVPIRAYLLRDDGVMTTLEKSLKRFCRCYWALSGIPPHSILAPVEVLTALILEWPQLGGAIQQDGGEILQCLRIAPVTAVALPPHRTTVCVEGITLASLGVRILQKSNISLQHLWDNVAVNWDNIQCHPSCLVVVFPSVYPTDNGGHCYSNLVVTDTDAPVQAGSGSTKYYLRSYVQHRHQGDPSGALHGGGHYVAHFRNSGIWYTADDTATTVRRQQDHKLPAAAFFELVGASAEED